MKKTLFKLAIITLSILALQSCNGVTKEHYSIPPGKDYQLLFEQISKTCGVEDPEIYEMSGTFKPGSYEGYTGTSTFEITLRTSKSVDKMAEYYYNFETGWGSPSEITIYEHTGRGGRKDLAYDEYKEYLFKQSEMPPFSEFENMYKKAIEASGYAEDKCYVQSFKMEKDEDAENTLFMVVQDKDDRKKKATVYFDMKGNVTDTEHEND
ncbi:hypothetical protein [Dysgonomonas sp. 25]|uniref:hypothetical protein n=1 Tax=Dysgonomonas sp. 25 TaxID=2302933 RepID=UPI0013D3933B|nr:hypothetical protein [Dysgonomonas sp. 25]NDV69503.1 hypothetical protein [Dysgonomonas sp. 25]